MLKLTSRLYEYTSDTKMADYYERALYNHILSTHDQSGPTGGTSYFMPLLPGGKREYDVHGNTCCHGSGLEYHVNYQEMIYHHAGDSLYVNLFIPSTLSWKEKDIRLTLQDGYLEKQAADITIHGNARFKLCLRIPGWMTDTPKLFINGEEAKYTADNNFAVIDRQFCDGDHITWQTPFAIRFETTPDDPETGSVMYGPLVMAADCESKEFLSIGGLSPEKTNDPTALVYGKHTFRPCYTIWNRPYHVYVRN
jgi:DUF1680 family protein